MTVRSTGRPGHPPVVGGPVARAAVARAAVVVVAVVAGAFAVVGFALAMLFEVQGFGVPRDIPPRTGHLVGYAAGVLAGVVVPAAAAWFLVPRGRPWVAGVAAVLLVAVGLALGAVVAGITP